MNGYCPEHSQICQDIGSIKAGIDSIDSSVKRLDDRINGSFEKIGEHITESEIFRGKVIKHEQILKIVQEERLNTVKASQWRIGIIVGIIIAIANIIFGIIMKIL